MLLIDENHVEPLANIRRELFTCVIGDVMDKLGLIHQFLPPRIKPLRRDTKLLGRAMPAISVDVFAGEVELTANPLMNRPFGLMLEALDDLKPDEVYVNTGPAPRAALWGELMSTRVA